MLMTKILRYRKPILMGLLIPLSLLLVNAQAFARGDEQPAEVARVGWKVEGEIVVISYDLVAPANTEYEVSVVLKDSDNVLFSFIPHAVSGDVGRVATAGTNKEIRWEYKKDFPDGLPGENYYFEVSAVPAGGGFPWLWVGIGLAAAGGAAVVLGAKKESGGGETVLPLPPGRP